MCNLASLAILSIILPLQMTAVLSAVSNYPVAPTVDLGYAIYMASVVKVQTHILDLHFKTYSPEPYKTLLNSHSSGRQLLFQILQLLQHPLRGTTSRPPTIL